MSKARVFQVFDLDRLERRVLPSQVLGADNPATIPVPSTYTAFMALHEEFLAEAAQGGANVVFLGDSITQQWGLPGLPSMGTPAWNAQIAPLAAQNFGIAGDQTQNLLWRIENGELAGHPQVAVVMIGTNDFTAGLSPLQTVQGVATVLQAIHAESPETRVLLMSVLPRSFSPDDPLRLDVDRLDTLLPALADGDRVRYLDISGDFVNPDGTLNTDDYQPGEVHLSPEGYEIWANAVAPVLRGMVDASVPMVPAPDNAAATSSASPPPAAPAPLSSAPATDPASSASAVDVPVDTTSPDLIVPLPADLSHGPIGPVVSGTDTSHRPADDLNAGLSSD